MRIMVVSDTHGEFDKFNKAVLAQQSAQIVIHLGDQNGELEDVRSLYPDKCFIGVRGNCDLGSKLPDSEELNLEGTKIYMTHGHLHNVKLGFGEISAAARKRDANIVLFGHTHCPFCEYITGLHMLNPGSLRMTDTYATIDILENGIVTNIVDMRKNKVYSEFDIDLLYY